MQEPSTRLIVKNVPKHVDEKRLRQHFAERGEVSLLQTSSDGDHPKVLYLLYREQLVSQVLLKVGGLGVFSLDSTTGLYRRYKRASSVALASHDV